jgi:hypothetical protein
MVWFLVDDNLTFHKKVTTAGNAAMGVWVRAGAWSTSSLTDGFVPTQIARAIGTPQQLTRLVDSGLFERVPGGYQFHDWHHKQPSKQDVEERRERDRQRKADQRKRENVTVDVHAKIPTTPRARPHPTQPSLGLGGDLTTDSAPPPSTAVGGTRSPTQNRKPDWLESIADCDLCDDEGMQKPALLLKCDHIDRRQTHANGMAAIREQLNEAKARKANQ